MLTECAISECQHYLVNVGHHGHISDPHHFEPAEFQLAKQYRMSVHACTQKMIATLTLIVLWRTMLLFQKQSRPSLLTVTMTPSLSLSRPPTARPASAPLSLPPPPPPPPLLMFGRKVIRLMGSLYALAVLWTKNDKQALNPIMNLLATHI